MAVPFLFVPLLCSLKFGESSQKQRKDKRERRDGKANASLAEVAWQIQGAVPYLRLEEAKKESAEKGGDQGKKKVKYAQLPVSDEKVGDHDHGKGKQAGLGHNFGQAFFLKFKSPLGDENTGQFGHIGQVVAKKKLRRLVTVKKQQPEEAGQGHGKGCVDGVDPFRRGFFQRPEKEIVDEEHERSNDPLPATGGHREIGDQAGAENGGIIES